MSDPAQGPGAPLPTFLGIGSPRAGSTWLYNVLDLHPQVQMSQGRKEVHYWDLNHDKGLDWYARFFPEQVAPGVVAVGEYTPDYLYDPAVPERIAAHRARFGSGPDRFIVTVREPIARLTSYHRFRQLVDGYRGGLDDFIADYPGSAESGLYSRHLARWFDRFDRDRFLVLAFEDLVEDPTLTKAQLADFLGIDPAAFPADDAPIGRNESRSSGLPRLETTARRLARWLRRRDLDGPLRVGKRLYRRIPRGERPIEQPAPIGPDTERRLREYYAGEADRLARLTGLDLADRWAPPRPPTDPSA